MVSSRLSRARRARAARLAILATALPLLGACSSAVTSMKADRTVLLLSDRPAPREGCRILFEPSPLPGVAQLADSAALVAAIRAHAATERLADPRMFMLFSVRYDRTGSVTRVRAVDFFMPPAATASLQAVLEAHLRPQSFGEGSLRVRIDPTTSQVRIGRSERCEPRALTRFEVHSPAAATTPNLQPALLRVRVGEDGRMIGWQMLRSTGEQELDRWITQKLSEHRYQPGLVDGLPEVMDYDQTVRVRAR